MNNVLMYSKRVCPFCVRAKGLLKAKGVITSEVLIDTDMEKREEMLSRSNGQMTVPQIFIGDYHVGGCDDLFALDRNGELDNLLKVTS